jgi:HSP20 family protein
VQKTSDPPFSRFTRQAGKILESVSQGYCGFAHTNQTWAPSVNLYETADAYRVCVDLAGVNKDRIDVNVTGQVLSIRGQRDVPRTPHATSAAAQRARVHRMEIDHGPFAREVELPADVDSAAITATYRNGLLWIELPKR